MLDSSSSSPALANVTFSGNWAAYGGGMYNQRSSPTLTNVTFSGNSATSSGGGMYNRLRSSPALDERHLQRQLGDLRRRDVQHLPAARR